MFANLLKSRRSILIPVFFRYAPSHQFFHRPFYVMSLILIRKSPSSSFKADLAVFFMEIKDFFIRWTYSQQRQAFVVAPVCG